MNPKLRNIIPLAGLLLVMPALQAADESTPKKETRKEIRVLAAPDGAVAPGARMERQMKFINAGNVEMETVTFLGVQTSPVGPTLGAQLGLAKDHGLVVVEVVPESPAAAVLQPHDILLKFNDQILIDIRQLSVLVRSAKAGDEVALTYMRAGKSAIAKVKLGQKEIPKQTGFGLAPAAPGFNWQGMTSSVAPVASTSRVDADRLLGMIEMGRDGVSRVVRHNELGGDRMISITVNTGDNTMSYNDDKGSLEVTTKDGMKELVAKDAKGETVFSGPINTPEQRASVPAEVLDRLTKIEGMQGFSFRTGEGFQGGEMKVIRPLGRGISLPLNETPEGAQPARRMRVL